MDVQATPWYADWSFWTLVATVVFSAIAIYLKIRKEQRDYNRSLEEKLDQKADKRNTEIKFDEVNSRLETVPSKDYVDKEVGRARGAADRASQKASDSSDVRNTVLHMVTNIANETANQNTKMADIRTEVSDNYVKKTELADHKKTNAEEHRRIHERIDRFDDRTRHDG